jgi:uncharacterized damage-inducible protein DinB
MPDIKSLLDTYSRTPAKIELAVSGLSESKLRWKPNPKKWSIREIVCHLADAEIVGVSRMLLVIAASGSTSPALVPYDQDVLAERSNYNTADELLALQTFKVVRKTTTAKLRSLPTAAFEKIGHHPERGTMTLAMLLELYTTHGEKHLKQIETLKEQLLTAEG